MSDYNKSIIEADELAPFWALIDRLRAAHIIDLDEAQTQWELQRKTNRIDFIAVAVGEKTEAELQKEIAAMSRASEDKKKEWLSIATDGLLTGASTDSSKFYRLPEEEFRLALKANDNSLERQVRIFGKFLTIWHTDYELPPPYSATRIAIILSKAKCFDEEFAFLEQYERHFGHFAGSQSHEKLLERLKKKRIKRDSGTDE